MDTTPPHSSGSNRPSYSCIRCVDRKVKCDRERPCSACVRHKVDCVYNALPPPRKRHKRDHDQALTERLRQYETLLQEQGIDPSKIPDTPDSESCRRSSVALSIAPKESQVQTPCSVESDSNRAINKSQVIHVQGRSRFVDNPLWSRVVEEFHDPGDALENSSNDATDPESSDGEYDFVLGSSAKSKARLTHPPTEHIHHLCQLFIENVDPLTKLVHIPTLRPALQKAASNISNVPRNFETLMFAIYSAAIMSLKDDECRQKFNESRKALLSRYIAATKAALSQAKVMSTVSLVVLQALALHIIVVRDIYEPRATYSLTGVALRIAESMGLDRDGTLFNIPPFETEMRRRIWSLLKTHDFRTAELCGLPKLRHLDARPERAHWISNLNDSQLYPGMTALPPDSDSLTDVVFVAARDELNRFATQRVARFREQGKAANQWDLAATGPDKIEIENAISEVKTLLETKFIRYCDPSQPLHLMTMLLARIAMNIMRFLTHHPRRWAKISSTPDSEREMVWETSVKLIEQQNMLQSSPQLKHFAWHAKYFLTWHAIIHVLDTLLANPLKEDAEKTWGLIGELYANNLELAGGGERRLIYVAVGTLVLRAWGAREVAVGRESGYEVVTPGFISQLRLQRETAKSKRRARESAGPQRRNVSGQEEAPQQPVLPQTYQQNTPSSIGTSPSSYAQYPSTQHLSTTTTPVPTPTPTTNTNINTPSTQENLWYTTGFNSTAAPSLNNFNDFDFDFPDMMYNVPNTYNQAGDFNLDVDGNGDGGVDANGNGNGNVTEGGGGGGGGVSWEMWDAWLAESSRPLNMGFGGGFAG